MNKSKILYVVILLLFGCIACKEPKLTETIEVSELTIATIHKAYQEGNYTSHQLVNEYLQRIKNQDSILNSITTINPKALQRFQEKPQGHQAGYTNLQVEQKSLHLEQWQTVVRLVWVCDDLCLYLSPFISCEKPCC